MKKFIILLVFLSFMQSCVKLKTEKINQSNRPYVEIVPFEKIDLNEDGNITKEEFKVAQKSVTTYNTSSHKEPAWTFAGIMAVVGVLILLSSLLNIKNKKKNVGD